MPRDDEKPIKFTIQVSRDPGRVWCAVLVREDGTRMGWGCSDFGGWRQAVDNAVLAAALDTGLVK